MDHTDNKKVYILENKFKEVDLSQYTHIRVYHACRPTNINDYLKKVYMDFQKKKHTA